MKATRFVKVGFGTGALLVGMTIVPATAASAAPRTAVPCPSPGVQATALVNAIAAANVAGGGTVNLASGCTYTLRVGSSVPGIGPTGLLVTADIAINGNGATIARSAAPGTPAFRIFAVVGTLSVQDLTITNGLSSVGGGIASKGTVTLNHSVVTGNTANGAEGPGTPGGGGIFNAGGTLTLNNSQVNGNSAGGANGGGIVNANGTVVLNSSQVNANMAGSGGGIASGNQNGSIGGGGGLTLNKSQVDDNTATSPVFPAAGGIANGGTAVLNSSEVDGNVLTGPGAVGGGIANHGAMTLNKSKVDGNTATSEGSGGGGGIVNVNAAVANGGTEVPGTGVLTINNSEVNGNSTDGVGGGIYNFQADPSFTLQLTVNHSQLNNNTAGAGGAIFTDNPTTVTLATTSFSGNSPDNCEPLGLIPGCVG